MRQTFLLHHGIPTRNFSIMILILGALLLWLPCLSAAGPITPSGLNTQVSDPMTVGAHTQYNITGGTRPGGGANLFHSFGDFNVPPNNIANFQNTLVNGAFPHTDNILARVTGTNGNNPTLSSIYGTIQTSNFENANLFLMNPAGFLFGPNATINVGGMMTFTTADYMRLRGLDGSNAGIFHADTAQTSILTSAPVAAFGFIGSNPAAIDFKGGQLTVANGAGITLVGGDINLVPDSSGTPSNITAPGRQIRLTSVAGLGEVAVDTGVPTPGMALGTITLGQGTTLDTSYNSGASLVGDGSGGAISIRGGQLVATGAQIFTNPASGSTGQGGALSITVEDTASFTTNSFIFTSSASPNGDAGLISIKASHVILQDSAIIAEYGGDGTTAGSGGAVTLTGTASVDLARSVIFTDTSSVSEGNGGAVSITAPIVTLEDSLLFTDALASGVPASTASGGAITLNATASVSLIRTLIDTETFDTRGNSGPVTITAPTVMIVGNPPGSTIDTSTHNTLFDPSAGNGGDIKISGTNITLTDFATLGSFADSPGTFSRGGDIRITGTQNILLGNGTFFLTSTTSQAPAGNIELLGQHVTISQSKLESNSIAIGDSGTIKITGTEEVAISSGSFISTSATPNSAGSDSDGSAGPIDINTPQLTITGGSQVLSGTFGSGPSGTITIKDTSGPAQSVLISGPGSGIFTDTHDTGAGGRINVLANTVTLENGGILSAATSGNAASATGGTITVDAADTVTMNSASITAKSTGVADAGSINITALNGFTMQNSTVTTQAGQGAGGGNIKVTTSPEATVLLENSQVSASVADGRGGGGNISIDPQFVILQNSQILAQAAQGQGGAITITAGLFLQDANSIVNADSGSGVNGTVTIQSPNAPISGQIQPLGKTPLLATTLLNQHCASLADGQFSSFTVAGRDSLPTEPGGWLASPLYAAGVGEGQGVGGTGLEGDAPILSLRQIAPAGFLTQAFAVDWSASCQS